MIGLGLADALAYAVPELPKHLVPAMVERYRFHYLSRDAALPLFPGVREIVVALKEAGHFVAVATGKSRVGLDRALDHCGLRPLFDATRCADECRSKPDPQMLWDLGDELGVRSDRTLMIGDTTHDLHDGRERRRARRSPSATARITSESLEGQGALAIVGSPAQLAAWLESNT